MVTLILTVGEMSILSRIWFPNGLSSNHLEWAFTPCLRHVQPDKSYWQWSFSMAMLDPERLIEFNWKDAHKRWSCNKNSGLLWLNHHKNHSAESEVGNLYYLWARSIIQLLVDPRIVGRDLGGLGWCWSLTWSQVGGSTLGASYNWFWNIDTIISCHVWSICDIAAVAIVSSYQNLLVSLHPFFK